MSELKKEEISLMAKVLYRLLEGDAHMLDPKEMDQAWELAEKIIEDEREE